MQLCEPKLCCQVLLESSSFPLTTLPNKPGLFSLFLMVLSWTLTFNMLTVWNVSLFLSTVSALLFVKFMLTHCHVSCLTDNIFWAFIECFTVWAVLLAAHLTSYCCLFQESIGHLAHHIGSDCLERLWGGSSTCHFVSRPMQDAIWSHTCSSNQPMYTHYQSAVRAQTCSQHSCSYSHKHKPSPPPPT